MKKLMKYIGITTIALTAIGVKMRANKKLNKLESINQRLGQKIINKSKF